MAAITARAVTGSTVIQQNFGGPEKYVSTDGVMRGIRFPVMNVNGFHHATGTRRMIPAPAARTVRHLSGPLRQ